MQPQRLGLGRLALVGVGIGLGLLAVGPPAHATVTQVDGTILPATAAFQPFIDAREGAGIINIVRDASELPQLFRPNLAQPVVFRDLAEGAGFENSFGWYNVGDDVLTAAGRAANLVPVMGCGVSMVAGGASSTVHGGNPSFYVLNAEPTSQIAVDFASEQLAGRYKGGFIGFYLITPEANPSPTNCGDFKNDGNGLSLLGRIYFTQKDLNDDGDFVHHLVYASRTVTNRFYFGFEDLFRGGDNDFEDMAMEITGLTPPCVPQAELCDGLDNDCDGLIDGADPNLVGVADVCTCDGVDLSCTNGPRTGQCQTGVTVCTGGAIACQGTGTPSPETCNGTDENCNGQIDDNPTGTGAGCDGADADLCVEGAIVCETGVLVCGDLTGPNLELCNNVDDDCDGTIDEGNPGGGGTCGTALGECSPGTLACTGGALACLGEVTGGPELCNGLDDDCNGVADDGPADVGAACGSTDVGECSLGLTVCLGGTLACAGELGPSPETCDSQDDDCNGVVDDAPVDAGQPCGQSMGACAPGAYACTGGSLACVGGQGPVLEQCNGIDDDCDGVVDNDVPGVGIDCDGGGAGACAGATTRCIDGALVCVGGAGGGTETCNDVDDDCDGIIDDGDLCAGGVCDNGACAAPCAGGEFPCPPGRNCVDNFCVADPCADVACPPDAAGAGRTCTDGACVTLCSLVDCQLDRVCRPSDGACVPATCDYLPLCGPEELCVNSTCVVDQCLGVTCDDAAFCRDGTCTASCAGVACFGGDVCRDGACVESGCAGPCRNGNVCDPTAGTCVPDQCDGVTCPSTQACDPLTGACASDPCLGIVCPGTQACSMGQCGLTSSGELITTGGGGGCNAAGGSSERPGGALVALIALGLALGRRRRRALAAVVTLGLLAPLTSCDVNDYCLGCEVAGQDDGDGGPTDANPTIDAGGAGCDPNVVLPETCNLADDDCDGSVDEDFDLSADELNCGGCGIDCNKPGAQTQCSIGACTITGCFPGFIDQDGDTTGPYAASNGCELVCFPSNGGIEACDGLDNDCNGEVDDGLNLATDPANCGSCGRTCDFFEAVGTCAAGVCGFDPMTDCAPGFYDYDNDQATGCEYACTVTSGGVESCDLIDNDCDGVVDDGFDVANDPSNCGRCGLTCGFANADAQCVAGNCTFDPAVDCNPGYVDVNGTPLDGCEYACTPSAGGVETCDGIDNDCNGIADDSPVDVGAACASTGAATGACVADGVVTCAAGVLVCAGATTAVSEICDNVDNDCDAAVDDGVSQACYGGPPGTSGVGRCRAGLETCSAGAFGACTGALEPTAELCNNIDDDCDAAVDLDGAGMPLTTVCYDGPVATAGVGVCRAGTKTCAFGALGACVGQTVPITTDRCGDGLDTDCDALDDNAEGCLAQDPEARLDGDGALGTAAGTQHSYDLVLAAGGAPTGSRLYAAWSERVGGATEVYLRISADGGVTWGAIVNLTSAVAASAVKPILAIEPGSPDRVVVAFQTISSGVRDIVVRASVNGGATFSAASAALDSSGDSFHHAVAVHGTTIVVTWERLNTATLNRDVINRTSTDGGATFGVERTINVGSGVARFAGRPQVGLTSAGGTVWLWREQRTGGTRDIFAASVAIAGAAPTADIRIDSDSTDKRDSDFPLLRVVGSNAYAVWQDVSTVAGGGSDAMFVRSIDGGVTWAAERVLDDPAAEVSSSFTPTLAVDPRGAGGADDRVAVAWEDRRQGAQIFVAVSTDGAATFAAGVRASSEGGDPATGESSAPQLASAGNGVLAVVYANRLTGAAPQAFLATSIDLGATWTFSHARLDTGIGPIDAPQVVEAQIAGAAAAVAGWTDFRAGTRINGDIYVAISR